MMQKLYMMIFVLSFNVSAVFSSSLPDRKSKSGKKNNSYVEEQTKIATIIASEPSSIAPAFISTQRMFLEYTVGKKMLSAGKKE